MRKFHNILIKLFLVGFAFLLVSDSWAIEVIQSKNEADLIKSNTRKFNEHAGEEEKDDGMYGFVNLQGQARQGNRQ